MINSTLGEFIYNVIIKISLITIMPCFWTLHRGARILKAVVDNLADNQGMQGDAITDFLLTGCSG